MTIGSGIGLLGFCLFILGLLVIEAYNKKQEKSYNDKLNEETAILTFKVNDKVLLWWERPVSPAHLEIIKKKYQALGLSAEVMCGAARPSAIISTSKEGNSNVGFKRDS